MLLAIFLTLLTFKLLGIVNCSWWIVTLPINIAVVTAILKVTLEKLEGKSE